jgi:hypothetical protein
LFFIVEPVVISSVAGEAEMEGIFQELHPPDQFQHVEYLPYSPADEILPIPLA